MHYFLEQRNAELKTCNTSSLDPFPSKPLNRDAASHAFHSLNLNADPSEILSRYIKAWQTRATLHERKRYGLTSLTTHSQESLTASHE